MSGLSVSRCSEDRSQEFIHLSNSLEVHYTEPEARPAGAENLTLFAKSKLPESADAAFKDGIPAPRARSDGEALARVAGNKRERERELMPGY